jgi:hypothetical protein
MKCKICANTSIPLFKAKILGNKKEDLLNMLLKRISASMSDVISTDYDDDGNIVSVLVPSHLVDGQVLDGLKINRKKDGEVSIDVKLPPKEKAIELVAKIEKYITTGNDVNINNRLIIEQNEAANLAYKNRMERLKQSRTPSDMFKNATDSNG